MFATTLCRLAERQGILRGDLNGLQQRALEACMLFEEKERAEREEQRLKNDWIRTHPDKAKKIEAIFSKNPDADLSAPEEEYKETAEVDEQTQQVLDDLASKGFAFT